jgi:protein-tyrosine kinase
MTTDTVKRLTEAPANRRRAAARSIGAILIDAGRLNVDAAERILRLQKEGGLRFGAAGVELGLLTEADLQFALARQYDYPYLVKGDSAVSAELVAAFSPFSPQVEALRGLRSQLMLRWFTSESAAKSLAIVSPGRGEGRSYLAANLAVVCSQLGERTLLVDADMRHSRQHQVFGLENQVGLSTVLAERAEAQHAVQRISDFVDLSVMTAGPPAPNPQELIGRAAFPVLLEELGTQFDVIILDTPVADPYADAATLCVACGGALMVTRPNYSNLKKSEKLHSTLSQLRVAIVGGVVNKF